MQYRFPKWKDAHWNSYERQAQRYAAIRPFLGEQLVGAEFGVYKGGFGEFLLGHCRRLYLVDPWYRMGGHWKSGIAGDSRVDTVIDILTRYKPEIEEGRIVPVVDYCETFLRTVEDRHFDFVYIDAVHRYDNLLRQLQLARRKVKEGGYIFGDDFEPDPEAPHHGVHQAVLRFREETGADLVVDDARQWGLAVR